MPDFDGLVAVVTGSESGIGAATAALLAERGATVAGLDVTTGCDVRDTASVEAGVAAAADRHGRIDVLVNNAGLFRLHKSEEMPESDWRIQIDVMLTGVFLCTQAVARVMIERRAGSVVNIASIGGMGGWPMRAAYNAAKAGVINLTEVLAVEWAQYNVRLNCVSPGVTRTEMVDSAIAKGIANLDQYTNRTPLGRLAEVREIADAVLFLASDRASYVTGQNLRVDGGWVPYANPHGTGFPEDEPDG